MTLQRQLPATARRARLLPEGVAMRFEVVERGRRRALRGEQVDDVRRRCCLFVDVEAGTIGVAAHTLSRRSTGAALLAEIVAAAGAPVSAEELYCRVWAAPTYHPLRHRNTLYVAMYRLRRSLDDLLPGRTVIDTTPGGWRVRGDVDVVAMLRRLG